MHKYALPPRRTKARSFEKLPQKLDHDDENPLDHDDDDFDGEAGRGGGCSVREVIAGLLAVSSILVAASLWMIGLDE
eukprot:1332257-Prymnesium_polylepis.1